MLPNAFRKFIELLEENNVQYLVVGEYAVSMHGYPRYTGDLDIFIAIDRVCASGVLKTFRDFGFTDLEIEESDFMEPDMIVEIGREPLKIQVMTGISGVTFSECYEEKKVIEIDGINIPFISYDKLIKNKSSTSRGKDKVDIEELGKRKKYGPTSQES